MGSGFWKAQFTGLLKIYKYIHTKWILSTTTGFESKLLGDAEPVGEAVALPLIIQQ